MTVADDSTSADSRSRLLQAGKDVFCEEGYRASVDRIAARAGVARQTLYNHFPCKADLFGEVVREATASLLIALDDDGTDLRQRLNRFGAIYRERLLSPDGLGFFRTLAAETVRFPELAAAFYRTGPVKTTERLSRVLRHAMDKGELRRDDPQFAANLLLSMLVGAERNHYLFSGEPLPAKIADDAARIVDCFLRAFAP